MKLHYWIVWLIWLGACMQASPPTEEKQQTSEAVPTNPIASFFQQHPSYQSDGFDFPVGKPNAKGYYNAQAFTKNAHLGDDWNGTGGGNTDLGDPIYAIANGYVKHAYDAGPGWGQVVRISHYLPDDSLHQWVESLYAHCDSMLVQTGDSVLRGDQIATIGNANGVYWAHLHFEIRTDSSLVLGGGYAVDTAGYCNPTVFIQQHRPN
ncbi:MAG: M23 family metallopeptidase [Bacteroidota bacterium]